MSQSIFTVQSSSVNQTDSRGSVIAIGNFDGFHLGHHRIIGTQKAIAAEKNLESIIVTFNPATRIFFNPDFPTISTQEQKKRILESQKTDKVCIFDFDRIVNIPGEEFLNEYLIRQFHMKHIVMGENFRFGKGRGSDIQFLSEASQRYGFGFTVVQPVLLDGIRISSSLIRELLAQGKIEESNRMLGRSYMIEGIVSEGDKLGRKMGFPTINIQTGNKLLPEGVFKTSVSINGKLHAAIAYIGMRPTFNGKEKKVEAHIFDFDRFIYGENVSLYFEKKIRDEMTFDSESSLIEQIKNDIKKLKG